MTLTKQIAKYIHPVLKKHGFTKINHYWRCENHGFYIVVAVGSGKQSATQDFLHLELGVFSIEIEELYGARIALGSPMSHMPGGIPLCHFVTSLFQIDENLNWHEGLGSTRFFSCDTDVSIEFSSISEKLNGLLLRFIKKFSSIETLLDCRQKGIGAWARSTEGKLHGAAGCIILGRYDQAEEFMKSAIKIGSTPMMKETAERFRKIILKRRAGEG